MKNNPSFDPRNFGVQKLGELVRKQKYLDVKEVPVGDGSANAHLHVRLKPGSPARQRRNNPEAGMEQVPRHKSRKFSAVFWITVVLNGFALHWLTTPAGRALQGQLDLIATSLATAGLR